MASGDGDDKAFVWRIVKQDPAQIEEAKQAEEEQKEGASQSSEYRAELVKELEGHTETVEFCKFDTSGKWLVTGGMNNLLRVWNVAEGFTLQRTLDAIPQEDLNFVEWHDKAPLILTGGKDYMVWLVNAVSGKVMANFIGHEEEVLRAEFTKDDNGKHVVSSSADKTIRVWSPIKQDQQCVTTLRSHGAGSRKLFHEAQILCFALHPSMPVVLSGDEDGLVYAS